MARIRIGYHQYLLLDAGQVDDLDVPTSTDPWPPGAGAVYAPGWPATAIRTGTDTGVMEIELTVHSTPPLPLPGWEEVYEAEQVTVTGDVTVWSLDAGPSEPPLPHYYAELGSRYGVRLHVSGRTGAEEAGAVVEEPVERHHLQLWPVDPADQRDGPAPRRPPRGWNRHVSGPPSPSAPFPLPPDLPPATGDVVNIHRRVDGPPPPT